MIDPVTIANDELMSLLARIIGAINPDNTPEVRNERAEQAKVLWAQLNSRLKSDRLEAQKKEKRRIRAEERRLDELADALHDPYYGSD